MIELRETRTRRDNRAVTAFFRVFGGRLDELQGDAVRLAAFPGGHRGEWRFLSVLVPMIAGAALFDSLWRLGGVWAAVALVVPLLFLGMNVMAFGLGGETPRAQWWRWSLVLTLWAGWMVMRGGATPMAGFGWAWVVWLGLEVVGLLGLGWRGVMGVSGKAGVVVRWVIAMAVHGVMIWLWWRHGWPWGLATGAGICAVYLWVTMNPGSQGFGPVATRVEGEGSLLTIDDGPDPEDTPAILDLLDEFGEKAVFFVIGEKVRRYPELVREIVRRGHELGNHTLTHPQESFWIGGSRRTRREIAGCSEVIEEVTGGRPRWFRAPVGHRNWFTHPIAAELGLEVVAWNRRAFDTVSRDVEGIARRLTEGVKDGDVVLVHEGTPVAREVVRRVLEERQRVASRK